MPIYKFIVSIKNAPTTYIPQTFDIEMVSTLRKHQESDPQNNEKPLVTIYASDTNPYLDSYTSFDDPNSNGLSKKYCEDVEECFRTVIRAFNISDNSYDVRVDYHGNVHRMH